MKSCGYFVDPEAGVYHQETVSDARVHAISPSDSGTRPFMSISLKRVYQTPAPSDGCRILVERLWTRGLSKQDAKIDLWAKQAAPSTELRRWFNHEPDKWAEFQRRYFKELSARGGNRWSPSWNASKRVRSPLSLPRESHGSTTPSLSRSTWSAQVVRRPAIKMTMSDSSDQKEWSLPIVWILLVIGVVVFF